MIRYIGALGARVICDNIPGLVNKQRQLCQRHPDIMQAIGEGTKEWIRECQHQFRHHRWNCSTLDRDHTVFGRVLLRSKPTCVYFCLYYYWQCSQRVQTECGPKLHLLLICPLILTLLHFYCLTSLFSILSFCPRSVLSPVFLSCTHMCLCSMFIVANGLLQCLTPCQ